MKLLKYHMIIYININNIFLKFATIPLVIKQDNYINLKSLDINDNEIGIYYFNESLLKTGIITQELKLNDIKFDTIFKINNGQIIIDR